jgi:hypothetical protein
MNLVPLFHQQIALRLNFLQDASQIRLLEAGAPEKRDGIKRQFRLSSLTENMHVRRVMIIGEDHISAAMRVMNRDHLNNPSLLGFQEPSCLERPEIG